ncbi:hypothetical protein [Singulisphaera sp. PoT]
MKPDPPSRMPTEAAEAERVKARRKAKKPRRTKRSAEKAMR